MPIGPPYSEVRHGRQPYAEAVQACMRQFCRSDTFVSSAEHDSRVEHQLMVPAPHDKHVEAGYEQGNKFDNLEQTVP